MEDIQLNTNEKVNKKVMEKSLKFRVYHFINYPSYENLFKTFSTETEI